MALKTPLVVLFALLGVLLIQRFRRAKPSCLIIQNDELRWILVIPKAHIPKAALL
jgi:hypothetical protein